MMTIRRYWTIVVPLVGEVKRSKTLKPGYTEDVIMDANPDTTGRRTPYERRIRVLNSNSLRVHPSLVFGTPPVTKERDEINKPINDVGQPYDPDYTFEALVDRKGKVYKGRRIYIKWEPEIGESTLPPQARR